MTSGGLGFGYLFGTPIPSNVYLYGEISWRQVWLTSRPQIETLSFPVSTNKPNFNSWTCKFGGSLLDWKIRWIHFIYSISTIIRSHCLSICCESLMYCYYLNKINYELQSKKNSPMLLALHESSFTNHFVVVNLYLYQKTSTSAVRPSSPKALSTFLRCYYADVNRGWLCSDLDVRHVQLRVISCPFEGIYRYIHKNHQVESSLAPT